MQKIQKIIDTKANSVYLMYKSKQHLNTVRFFINFKTEYTIFKQQRLH